MLAAVALPVGGALAQGAAPGKACDPAPAKAVSVQGTVEAKRAAGTEWQPVKLNDTFCAGDSIRVQAKSRADVMLLNQSVMRLNANSTITIAPPKDQTTGVPMDVWKKMGQGFITAGGGTVYAFTDRLGAQLNLDLMVMLPSSGFVIQPSIGMVYGL